MADAKVAPHVSHRVHLAFVCEFPLWNSRAGHSSADGEVGGVSTLRLWAMGTTTKRSRSVPYQTGQTDSEPTQLRDGECSFSASGPESVHCRPCSISASSRARQRLQDSHGRWNADIASGVESLKMTSGTKQRERVVTKHIGGCRVKIGLL